MQNFYFDRVFVPQSGVSCSCDNPSENLNYHSDDCAQVLAEISLLLEETEQQISELEARRDALHGAIADGRFPESESDRRNNGEPEFAE